jgi:hypothetical protein
MQRPGFQLLLLAAAIAAAGFNVCLNQDEKLNPP